MHVFRTFRMSAVVALTALAVVAGGTTAAIAGKPAPAPTGLAATVTAHTDGTYVVHASWNAVAGATSYRVSLSKGGATLASATVKTASWTSPTVTTSPGNASLSVRGVVRRKPGRTATKTVPLPDVTPPQGSYSSTWSNTTGIARITQDSLTDNAGAAGVTRTVDWGDGTAPQSWSSGTTLDHPYGLVAKRYVPTVTLEDQAHNVTVVQVPAVVIEDVTPPTGSFTVAPASAWATYTAVTVTQQGALSDDFSPSNKITRTVDWKDGSAPEAWTSGTTLTHQYAAAGSYTPVVTIADEAHNTTDVSTSAVVVTADTVAPTVKLTLPKAKHSVRAWKVLRGKATDAQTGVKSVWVKAVEKRGTAWFGYNATTHAWVKAVSKRKAFAKAHAFSLTTNTRHRWSARLAKLRRGTLVYKVRATDNVGNRSATLTHKATLTKP